MSKFLSIGFVGLVLAGGMQAPGAEGADLGKLMFIGDSITHGFEAPSHRWALHKILVDNGVQFQVVGVTQGNRHGSIKPGTEYRGVPFNNRHSAMSGERTYEVSGRNNSSDRLGHSNIHDWLLLDKSYTGPYKLASADEMPEVFVILLGTNDTLCDWSRRDGIGNHIDEVQANLIGKGKDSDMDVVLDAIRTAAPDAKVYVMSVPTWSEKYMGRQPAADFAAVNRYNAAYKQWAEAHGVTFVDINGGMVDVTREDKPFVAVDTMFNAKDHLHPTRHGDLIMAGHVAKAMGYPGRDAGLKRGAVEGTADAPLTVELTGKVGDGAANGWDAKPLVSVTFPAGGKHGTLTISEGYLRWGDTVLYSMDFSANEEPVRISYVAPGNAAGVDAGFYVWLGDRLVGEALPGADGAAPFHADTGATGVKITTSAEALAPQAGK